MTAIRKATSLDLARIAEIYVFNYRLNFYPIFKNDEYYFSELQVPSQMEQLSDHISSIWVYDDGVVKGFIVLEHNEIKKLFVEPALQGNAIGSALLKYAIDEHHAKTLWALEKNTRAIAFYRRHGFLPNGERRLEEDTDEYLVRLERSAPHADY